MVLDNNSHPHTSEAEPSESTYLLPSLLYCMTYIDTQGMTLPSKRDIDTNIQHSPMPVKKMTVFTDMEREELKQMMREVFDEYA